MDRDALARPVTVAIIDDHPVAIEGVRSWIDRDPRQRATLIASGPSVQAVLAGPGRDADVLVLDLELGDEMIIDQVGELCGSGYRVVVYSNHDEREIVLAVIDAGARYVAKHESGDHCMSVILAAAADEPYVTPTEAGALLADDRPQRPHLSEQERTALLLWFQSMSKASVASRMGISEATVKQYIGRVRVKYTKIGRPVPTKTALLARAIEDGLLRADEVGDYRSRAV
ncbi:response regulator transcription factor [Dactylosporangium sp. NPDC051484]|uniref:response regulator transcription factor n=1 Tax=Dactylosporangium sp. NPDC051484 TaxID=3154942 RepID=UPI00344ED141